MWIKKLTFTRMFRKTRNEIIHHVKISTVYIMGKIPSEYWVIEKE